MTKGNDNVTAFVGSSGYAYEGLIKREYFAAMAMQGLLANQILKETKIAEAAVLYADALISELNKPTPNEQ